MEKKEKGGQQKKGGKKMGGDWFRGVEERGYWGG